MSRRIVEESILRVAFADPYLNLGSSTVTRVVVDEPAPEFKPRPVGFLATLEPVEADPVTWDGDQA